MPSISTPRRPLRIAIDRGGTFTDCIAQVDGQEDIVVKILSIDTKNYQDAPTEAIRRVLEIYRQHPIPRGSHLDLQDVEWIRMGTTVATNALLERKGERTAFLVTSGFKDILEIGNQSRPYMFDLTIRRPRPLYSEVFEVDERVVLERCNGSMLRSMQLEYPKASNLKTVVGTSGEMVHILKPLNVEKTRAYLQTLYAQGFRSIAICLMHSYIFPDHELQIFELATEIGFDHISTSHKVSTRPKIVPRGNSTVIDSYLTPPIEQYLSQFSAGFPDLGKGQGKGQENTTRLEFMQSDGALVPASELSGLHAILSGPAGGVVGYARTAYDPTTKVPIIGFDMGGTSTDVSRYDGEFDHIFETTTAGIPIQAAQLNVNTIAAGGGSILAWRDSLMAVGPESASSHPGPACYRKGGPLTVTDANLALGRLVSEQFPSVFGPNENQPLDREIVLAKFQALTDTINKDTGKSLTWAEVADGFLQVANSAMCGPIRQLTEGRGHDAAKHYLASFGGAGGQHACGIAKALGIQRVIIHRHSSILSAFGMGLADVVHDEERPCARIYNESTAPLILEDMDKLVEVTKSHSTMHPFSQIECQRFLFMRYDGSETSIMVSVDESQNITKKFTAAHHQQFGFTPDRPVFVDQIRVRAIGKSDFDIHSDGPYVRQDTKVRAADMISKADSVQPVYFSSSGWLDTPIYLLGSIPVGSSIKGPALIVDKTQTIVVNIRCSATAMKDSLVLDVHPENNSPISLEIDPVQLSVFRHRFFGVAEQMGHVLQKVSVSANIKERLDFSCAIFSPDGSLVANAPHVPAMIGSMGFSVKSQIKLWGGKLKDGDVLLSNSPEHGGVHLPDLTVITPVFDAGSSDIIFWTASRGHHADVGGILPGSMPPSSRRLWEEGALFESCLLVRDGKFNEAEVQKILCDLPARFSGSSGSRCFQDNLTDIKAQVAANNCGIRLVRQLISEYTMDVVQRYMGAIQDSAELAVRNLFKRVAKRLSSNKFQAVDYMDDGTPIQLNIKINEEDGSAIFDFRGTGPEVYGNWNAPIAICHAAVLFALRCMVDSDIPLNQGCMKPINMVIPDDCLLKPSLEAAVCAGNVLTSQRIVDVVFKALHVCAASQGCMNNFTFGIDGEDGFGYYETIAGGSGAGPGWHGTSGVHTNMTNTRITDPESLEQRYPVLLHQFSFRPGSGGKGAWNGGEGISRQVEFRVAMSASILSERRSLAPYGMDGGDEGQRGRNLWLSKESGMISSVGGKGSVSVGPGDRMIIETPGGGGYGQIQE